MKSGSKVKAWFEKLIKDLRAILDKAYNILKSQKSWEQMELIRNNKQTLDMIADYYFEGMEGTKGKASNTEKTDGNVKRSAKDINADTERFRFSRKDDVSVTPEDAKKLQKQNDKLKQALEVAKQEIKLSDGHHVKASAVERLAGKLLKEYSSKMDKAELVSNITELFDYIGNGENVVWDEVQAGAMNIALNVLDQSAKRNTEWYDNTKPAREFLFQSTLPTRGSDLSILFSVRDFFTFQSTLP